MAPLRVVSAAAMPPRMRVRDSGLRTVADELCGESARALSEAVWRSAEVSSRLVIDASLLIGHPALAVTDCGAGALMLVVGARGVGDSPRCCSARSAGTRPCTPFARSS